MRVREAAGTHDRYTNKFAKRRPATVLRRIARNAHEDMNRPAGFILDKGSYPRDIV
jgi:hypothetical protein